MKIRIPFLAEITDKFSRENFKHLDEEVYGYSLFKGKFKFFEKSFAASVYPATLTFPHGLGFLPQDVIQTYVVGGTVTWNYSSFTKELVSVTVSAATTVRFFLGRYEE